MTSGYSQTPLVRKLGIAPGDRVGVVGDPGHLAGLFDPLPPGARLIRNPRAPCPVLVAFAPTTKRGRHSGRATRSLNARLDQCQWRMAHNPI